MYSQILQDLVQKCLETCDQLRASTVAFPALGAGNLHYPQDIVADIMVNTIGAYLKANLSTTCIRTVKLVIFMEDTYAEFDKLLSSKSSVAGPSLVQEDLDDSHDPADLSSTEIFHKITATKPLPGRALATSQNAQVFTVGRMKVEILQGDITEDDSDAIVNTTNAKMQLEGSGVAGAILEKGGPEIQAVCDALVAQGIHLQEGKVCDTRATGNLKCSKVFHVVVPVSHKQMLGKTIAACLKRAEKLHLNSIAFPAIGTGNLGYSLEEAASEICSSIIAFGQKTNPFYVKQVRIVIFQQEMYQSFRDKFTDVTKKPGILKQMEKMGSNIVSWLYGDSSSVATEELSSGFPEKPLNSNNSSAKPVVMPYSPPFISRFTEKSVLLIQIYAEDQQKVSQTENRLQQIIENQFTNEKITNKYISKLPNKQKDSLVRKAKQKHVHIIIETGADLNYIQLKGDRTDVADMKFEIQDILSHISSSESTQREAKLLHEKITWQWSNGDANDNEDYEDYDEMTNYYIEEAYRHDVNAKFTYTLEGNISATFDFVKMEVNDTQLGVLKIKRVDIEELLKEGNQLYSSNFIELHR